jgi:hypothetical protein
LRQAKSILVFWGFSGDLRAFQKKQAITKKQQIAAKPSIRPVSAF